MVNNCFHFIGNVTKDIEVRMAGNSKVCNFSLGGSIGSGEYKHSVFPTFQAWNKQAELLEQYVKKGDKIAVEATYDENHWEDGDGNKRMTVRFTVTNIFFCGNSKGKAQSDDEDANPADIEADELPEDDSVPF